MTSIVLLSISCTHTHSIFPHTHVHARTHSHTLSIFLIQALLLFVSHALYLTRLELTYGDMIEYIQPFHLLSLFLSHFLSHYLSLSLSFSFESSPFVHLYFLGMIFYLCPSVRRLSFLVVENCKSFNLFAHMSCHDRGKNNPPLPAHTLPGQPIAAAYPEKLIKISATNSLEDFPLCQSEAIKFSF